MLLNADAAACTRSRPRRSATTAPSTPTGSTAWPTSTSASAPPASPCWGLAVRKYVLMRRGLLGTARQCLPAAPLSVTAQSEVEYLLGRLARHDSRARLGLRPAQA